MLNDVIESYGGEKVDPLDVYKDIFRIGEGFIQKEYEEKEVSKQIQLPIIRMRMKIMAILELCLKISLKKSIEMSLLMQIFV